MTLSTLEKLAKVLNVDLYEIFQFSTVETKEDMYTYILSKLNLIKNDDEKMRITYNIIKNLI